jgi:4-amino-4-deoxy-L-arabinose transferase-like glycosyltransferase
LGKIPTVFEDNRNYRIPVDNAPGRIDSTRVIAALLLTMMALVLGVLAWLQSPDYDEHTHVAAGVSYLERRDGRMNVEHPPLVKLLGGAGALIARVSGEYNSEAWRYAREFDFAIDLYTHADRDHLRMLTFLPRVPMILITLALGLTIYLWVSSISGRGAGLLSLAIYCTYPLFLAWGVFVLNDVAVALFSLLTCWAAVALWRNPSPRQIALFGLALGAALFAKFSAVLLFPVLALWLLVMLLQHWKKLPADRLRRVAWGFCGGILLAGTVVYVAYQLTFWQMPPHQFVQVWQERAQVQGTARTVEQQRKITRLKETLEKHPVAERMISPVFYYATGMYAVSVSTKRPSYILGQHYPTGRWFYFPVVALFKSPPGFLLIVGFGFLLLILHAGKWLQNPDVTIIFLMFAVLTAGYTWSGINIGMRHWIPAVACAIALACAVLVPEMMAFRDPWRKVAVVVCELAVLQILFVMVATYPFYLPYYNFLRGSHSRGWISPDSNVDHGTYLPWVRTFQQERQVDRVSLAAFSYTPTIWLPDAIPLDCANHNPSTQWVVASAALLEGPCAWLKSYPGEEIAGGSMWAFDLKSDRFGKP